MQRAKFMSVADSNLLKNRRTTCLAKTSSVKRGSWFFNSGTANGLTVYSIAFRRCKEAGEVCQNIRKRSVLKQLQALVEIVVKQVIQLFSKGFLEQI